MSTRRAKTPNQLDSEIAASIASGLFKKLRAGEQVELFSTLRNAPVRIDWSPDFGGTLRQKTNGDEQIVFMKQAQLRTWLRDSLINKLLRS